MLSLISPLVRIRDGEGAPLFIVHGIGGNVMELVALGRDMGQTGDLPAAEVPAGVAEVEFYVPSFFPSPAGSAGKAALPS